MCGIVGYIGTGSSQGFVMDGLSKLEYRGYDSSGIAMITDSGLQIIKKEGKLKNLSDILQENPLEGNVAIGHTRWATHGKPSDFNSHPHYNADKTLAVVHNGIIENYLDLKSYLIDRGYEFISETDTEVIIHLLDYYYNGDLLSSVKKVLTKLRGSYALCFISVSEPDKIIATRKESPLVIGLGEKENFIASDIPALLNHTRDILLIENEELVKITKNSIRILDKNDREQKREITKVTWDIEAASKNGYDFFMLKEINEQPEVILKTLNSRIDENGRVSFQDIGLTKEILEGISKIYLVACGTAANAGIIGKYIIEKYAKINVELDLASEFRYRKPLIDDKTLVIFLSQSGETLDTLEALRESKRHGAKTLTITNVVGSSLSREADHVIYTWAGPEIAVASTKAYTTQLIILYLFAIDIADKLGKIDKNEYSDVLKKLYSLSDKVQQVLDKSQEIESIAKKIKDKSDIFYLGRGLDYYVSIEAALKSKEISYIHSEAFASGELKHGTIALIEEGTPVVVSATQDDLIEKSISNIKEVSSRGGYIISVVKEGVEKIKEVSNDIFYIPNIEDDYSCFLTIIFHQLLAYHLSALKGNDVDKPRNLAKSVTVE